MYRHASRIPRAHSTRPSTDPHPSPARSHAIDRARIHRPTVHTIHPPIIHQSRLLARTHPHTHVIHTASTGIRSPRTRITYRSTTSTLYSNHMSDNIYYDTSSRSHTYDQTVSVRILFLCICHHLSRRRSSVGTRRRETTGWRRRRRRRSRSVRARTNSRARLEVRLRRVDRVYTESRASFNESCIRTTSRVDGRRPRGSFTRASVPLSSRGGCVVRRDAMCVASCRSSRAT